VTPPRGGVATPRPDRRTPSSGVASGTAGSLSTTECLKQREIREGEAPSEPEKKRLGRSLALPIDPKFEVP